MRDWLIGALILLGLWFSAPAHAGIVEDIERAERIMSQPWHVDTLTANDRDITQPAWAVSYLERGRASWYGRTGRRTAAGEKYPTDELTCAHKYLPFHTMVRVTALASGRSIRCRINDRGPAKWTHRIIDLNPRAAAGLGLVKPGVLKVKVEVIAND